MLNGVYARMYHYFDRSAAAKVDKCSDRTGGATIQTLHRKYS